MPAILLQRRVSASARALALFSTNCLASFVMPIFNVAMRVHYDTKPLRLVMFSLRKVESDGGSERGECRTRKRLNVFEVV
jgi:hypothetical protein